MLRDQIVCGINNNQLHKRILAEPDLTFKKALELAEAQEGADQGSRQLQQQQKHSLTPLHKIDHHHHLPLRPQPAAQGNPCYQCGESHLPTKC